MDSARPVHWIASSLDDVRGFPQPVRDEIGFALYEAQLGRKHVAAKPLKGMGGASVLEIVVRDAGNAFRCVYAVRIADAVYVLHAFQKKSTHGIRTSKHDLELIRQRLAAAKAHAKEHEHET